MPELPDCNCTGGVLETLDPQLYFLISPGTDPTSVLTQEEIDCFFDVVNQYNARQEGFWELEGRYVCWKSGPHWFDYTSEVKDYYSAAVLGSVDCDLETYDDQVENTAAWRWRGSWGKGAITYYCLGTEPPEPPPEEPPPPPGIVPCGTWGVSFVTPIVAEINEPVWVDFILIGTFPPEVDDPFDYHVFFDGSEDIAGPGESGVVEVDFENHRVQIVIRDFASHELLLLANQPDCEESQKLDIEIISVIPPEVPPCVEDLSSELIKVCTSGVYKAVVTGCDQDIESNEITVTTSSTNPFPPQITGHPESQTVVVGTEVQLVVQTIFGSSFQWQKMSGSNWVDIPGETSALLTIESAVPVDDGSYRVIVSNTVGSVASNAARVIVSCDYWFPAIYLQTGPDLVVSGTRILADDSELLGVPGVGDDVQVSVWLIDGVQVAGSGSVTGVDYDVTVENVMTLSVTDASTHSISFRTSVAICSAQKTATISVRAAKVSDFGPAQTIVTAQFSLAVAQADDPSVYVDLTNKTSLEGSELEVTVFTPSGSPTYTETPVVELEGGATNLGPMETGQIKTTLTAAGVTAFLNGDPMAYESYTATWSDDVASAAFGITASGTITVNAAFN